MDRQIIYAGAIPLETDLLNTNRNMMVAIGALGSALFGASTIANGLACAPTSPASMSVKVGNGEIYQVENLDDTAYSSLGADTTHQIVKQGILLDAVTLACPAPTTAGFSINYLVEVKFAETDLDLVTLPYYNSSDPTTAYSGPANSGVAQATTRQGGVTVSVKPGIAATTGTQGTPAPDTGFIGLWVVTVAFGATTITSSNIAQAPGAPIVPVGGIVNAVQDGGFLYAVASGTANALTANLAPTPAALVAGMAIVIKATATNTGAATLNLSGLGVKTITANGAGLSRGAIVSGQFYGLVYDGANWQLENPSGTIGLGVAAQAWTDVTVGRAVGTSYTNSTPLPIQVSVSIGTSVVAGTGQVVYFMVNGSYFRAGVAYNGESEAACYFVVPPGATYGISSSNSSMSASNIGLGTIGGTGWSELR